MIPRALQESVALRIPTFAHDATAQERFGGLEDHMLQATSRQGELASLRLETQESLRTLQREWDHMAGWEQFKRSKTEAAVEDAKRQVNPTLYDGIEDAKWLIARYSDEFERLGKDADRCSRLLTQGRLDAMIPHDFGRPIGGRS